MREVSVIAGREWKGGGEQSARVMQQGLDELVHRRKGEEERKVTRAPIG